jgi:hypothetical protein
MAPSFTITSDGRFELDGQPYRIPSEFSQREIFSYRRLLEPIPDIPGGTSLSDVQRDRQRAFFLRRAVACIVPGLQMRALRSLSDRKIRIIHHWLRDHRPALSEAYEEVAS